MQISSVKVEKFKRIQELEITINDLTVLIGGNNSGKSSFLQAVHFALTTLQSVRAAGSTDRQPATTLGFDQFTYKPTNDLVRLSNKSNMTQKNGPQFTFAFFEETEPDNVHEFKMALKRGKNANISVTFDSSDPFYEKASDPAQPISIFVPGLAGIALREERRTDAIVNAGIAQGDSNLYLRNVLLRIIQDSSKLERFHAIVGAIFPSLRISSSFDEKINQHIEILAEIDNEEIPLEMIGTGCLQAIQLVAYITMYNPSLLLLDEPDAHLHPSNQRILASTLLKITEQSSTKIVIASHSRHIFDALTSSDKTSIIWLKKGVRQERKPIEDLSILLDLGALDSYELLQGNQRKVLVLTEDEKSERLCKLLEANGFCHDEYLMQGYKGVGNIRAASVIAEFFLKQGNNTRVLIHRDGDCMLSDEIQWYLEREKKNILEHSELFVTRLTDIEHYFCRPEHIAAVYGMTIDEANQLIEKIITANNARFAMEFAQKRSDLKSKILREKADVPSATDLATGRIQFQQIKGKTLFGLLTQELQASGKNPAKLVSERTEALKDEQLLQFASQVWNNSN